MVGTLVRRERRPLWVALTLITAVAAATAAWFGGRARADAIREASVDARAVAQTDVAATLAPRDVLTPMTGDRGRAFRTELERSVLSNGTYDRVRIYGEAGRVLSAEIPTLVDTRPAGTVSIVHQAAGGHVQTRTVDGTLSTYVPIWLSTDGPVAVVELSQPAGPIEGAAAGPWNVAMVALGIVSLLCLAMTAVTARAPRRQRADAGATLYRPAIPRRPSAPVEPSAPAAAKDGPSVFGVDERRLLEEQLASAEARATAAEESFRTVQAQLKAALVELKDLEGRLAVIDQERATTSAELATLRDQVRETSERLHKADIDNNAMRERLALRQQDLDEARHELEVIRSSAGDTAELTVRLETAENAAAALSRELERVEAELDRTRPAFQLSKLSEALREFEDDSIGITIGEEEDDLYEHPVTIRNGTGLSSGKGR